MLSQYRTACHGCSNWIPPDKGGEGCGAERPAKTGEHNQFRFWGIFAIFSRSETNSWKLFFVLPLAVSHFRVQIVWSLISKGSSKCSQGMQPDLSWIVSDSTVFFFSPKNQFWVSRFVEANMCRVLCECVNLVSNYWPAAVFSSWVCVCVCVCVIVPTCVLVDTFCKRELTQEWYVWSKMLISLSGRLLTDVFRAVVSQSWSLGRWEVGRGAIGHRVVIHKSYETFQLEQVQTIVLKS